MLIDLFPKGPKLWQSSAIVLIVGMLSACTQVSPSRNNSPQGPKVVATTTVLCDLTQQIAEKTVDLNCLMKPGTDPHGYEPTPGDRQNLEQAKLLLMNGHGFEAKFSKLIQATSNPTRQVVEIAYIAAPPPKNVVEVDPHVWHDAQKGIGMVKGIHGALIQLVPTQKTTYSRTAEAMIAELSAIDAWIKAQVATIPPANRTLVTTHDALGYYAEAYGLPVEAALQGISTEEKSTSARMKALVNIVRASKVPTIFAERTINPKLIETVAKEAKVKVSDQALFTDGLGEAGSEGDTYQKMLIANTKTIVEGLGGTYTPFQPKAK